MICAMPDALPPLRRIYLDTAAATPLLPAVFSVMEPYLRECYGNPSSIHQEGIVAKQAITDSRLKIARTLGMRSDQVFFTGSGTESNNLAILGYVEALFQAGRAYETMEVITTAIEHPSVLELIPVLQSRGVRVVTVPVDESGSIRQSAFVAALTPQTVLVTFAYANSEIGVVQPVLRLVRAIRAYEKTAEITIQVHLDAAQAPLWLPCQIAKLGFDSLTLDAGKCGGPKGVGVIIVREPKRLRAIAYGGGQERGLRPGTEQVAGIVGAAEAITLAQAAYLERSEAVSVVRDAALARLPEFLPTAILNGPTGAARQANNINISLPGFDTEYAVVWLDKAGVAASTKSACAGAGSGRSHVVFACTGDAARAGATLRLSLSEATTLDDLLYTFKTLAQYAETMKGLTI
jgi:cysteine desulfurase